MTGWTPKCRCGDWHGVVCNTDFGGAVFSGLSLPNNNLTGSINELELLNNMFDRLDLSANRLSGTLEQIPFWITHVNLARNELAGTLPDIRAGTIIGTPPPDYFHVAFPLSRPVRQRFPTERYPKIGIGWP